MDISDLFVTPTTPGPRRSLSAEEHVACALGLLLFPLLTFLVVVLGRGWVWDHAELVLFGLPVLFSVLTYSLARRVGTTVGFALKVVPGCAVACFLSGCGAGLIAAFISFTETF